MSAMETDRPDVAAFEHGILRLYRIDTHRAEGRTLREAIDSGGPAADRALASALGLDAAEAEWTSMVGTGDLAGMGLDAYLATGHGVPAEQIAAASPVLDGLHGTLLVVPSRSFGGTARHLDPGPELVPVAVFDIAQTPAPALPMKRAEVPPGPVTPPRPAPPPARGGPALRPALIALAVVLAALLVALLALL